MTNPIVTTEFQTSKGARVIVTAELQLTKKVYADGHNVTVDCCEMGLVKADIDGHPQQTGFREFGAPVEHPDGWTLYGDIGKLGLTADNLAKVKMAIAGLESHPAWIAKQQKIHENMKAHAEMERKRESHVGWCKKCHSYCYGDCEAN